MHENSCPEQQPHLRVNQPTEDPVPPPHQMFVIAQAARERPVDLNRDVMLPESQTHSELCVWKTKGCGLLTSKEADGSLTPKWKPTVTWGPSGEDGQKRA